MEHRIGERKVTLQRVRTRTRERKGLVLLSLHVLGGALNEMAPSSALHTSDTTDRRCQASPAPHRRGVIDEERGMVCVSET